MAVLVLSGSRSFGLFVIASLCYIDYDFACPHIGIVVFVLDCFGSLSILKAHKGESAGRTLRVFGELTVSDLVYFGEVLDNIFLGEYFGYVFDDDSAHVVFVVY